jgi:3-keto-5-aminohexanoate cleavage enzyme
MAMPADAVIIEVGLNEGAGRGVNPHVPVTPQECAADALRCRDAGASLIHWHARDPVTGEQRLGDADLYAEALARMQAGGLLGYPSYPVDPGIAVGHRLDHVWDLQGRGLLEMAPIDLGSVSTALWNREVNDFVGLESLRAQSGVVDNPLTFVLDAVERATSLRLPVTFGAFDVGSSRILRMLAESRRVAGPALLKVFLSEGWAVGPIPSEAALDLHLAQLPDDLDVEWLVVPYSHSEPSVIERLCRAALERGGHVRVGIGDSPAANPEATNAELVEQVVAWAGDTGRPVAATAAVRSRLGLATGEIYDHG